MGHLNPRAKTFHGGHSGMTTAATVAHAGPTTRASPPHLTQSVMSSSSNTAPNYMLHMPATSAPTPTPSNSPSGSDDSKTPRVAPRFGHNWSTFPAAPASAGARSQHFGANSLLPSSDTITPYSHRSRSPSVPVILPSDEERRESIPPRTNLPAVDASLRALGRLQLDDTTPAFNPFGESSSSGSTGRDAARGDVLPRVTTHYSNSSSTYYSAATRDRSPNSSDSGNEHILYASSDSEESKNVYIANLPMEVTNEVLTQMGSQFGRVIYSSIHHAGTTVETFDMLPERAKMGPLPASFAFIMFTDIEASRRFIEVIPKVWSCQCMPAYETHQLKSKVHEDPHSSNLYVAEIPLNCTEQDLHNLMHPGVISSHRFLIDGSGNRRGVAMVRLQSRAQAEAAISRLDRKITMRGCVKPIQVRIADSESQKLYKKSGSGNVSPSGGLRRATSIATMQTPAPQPVATMPTPAPQAAPVAPLSPDLVYQELSERELQTAVQIGDGARQELIRRESMRALNTRASAPTLGSASIRQNSVTFPEMPMTPTTPTIFGSSSAEPWVLLPTSPTNATTRDTGRWERDNGRKMYTPDSESSSSSSSRAAPWNDRYGASSSSWRN